ncbi:DUF1643 domain-containing protein [Roseomonas marmotae]
MNPSVACTDYSDPTVQKTGRISRLGNAGGQVIVNTASYRSTDPQGLLSVDDLIDPENQATIARVASEPRVSKRIIREQDEPAPLRHIIML